MLGNMMRQPLLISSLLMHAERHHADTEVVSRTGRGDIHRYTYSDLAERSRRLANALTHLGVEQGTRVGTLAWNDYRHLELYYGVSGFGAVAHTLNPRLHPDQLAWIISHAGDEVLFFDSAFIGLVASIASRLNTVKTFVVLASRDEVGGVAGLDGMLFYEDLLSQASAAFSWPSFEENTASSLCYTSGTTGNPKGVLYSHRSTVLHSLIVALPDGMDCSASDAILPIVPMFHVNAWGLPYTACAVGAKLVLPGPFLDGKSIFDLCETEGVTIASGVPTIWMGLFNYMEETGRSLTTLRRTGIGGAACPPSMIRLFEEGCGIDVMHGWGMTETSPMVTVGTLKAKHRAYGMDDVVRLKSRQGRAVFGTDIKIVDDGGDELPWDGREAGELMVRGHWIVEDYYEALPGSLLKDDWFPTGDVATIDPDGFIKITDRKKDLIKSGGEWISSLDLENIAVSHPAVAMAACLGVAHPKWGERPIMVVVKKPNCVLEGRDLIAFFEGKIAKWWLPDEVVFVDSIPIGPTGKLQKNKLREMLVTDAGYDPA